VEGSLFSLARDTNTVLCDAAAANAEFARCAVWLLAQLCSAKVWWLARACVTVMPRAWL
jgi:hypothetical protein